MVLLTVVWRTLGGGRRQAVTLFAMVFGTLMLSLFLAILEGYQRQFSQASDDVLVVRRAKPGLLPVVIGRQIGQREEIRDVAHLLTIPGSRGETSFVVEAVGGVSRVFETMGLDVDPELEAALRSSRTGVLIGEELADDMDVGVGDALIVRAALPVQDGTYELPFEVVGVCEASGLLTPNRLFANYDYIDAMLLDDAVAAEDPSFGTGAGAITTLFLAVAPDTTVGEVSSAIEDQSLNSAFPLRVLPMASWLSVHGQPIGDLLKLTTIVGGLIAGIALLIQGSATAHGISEKGPMLAILLLHGHSLVSVWAAVATIVALQSVVATSTGLALAYQLFPAFSQALAGPLNFPVSLLPLIVGGAFLFALVITAVPTVLRLTEPLARLLANVTR